MRPNQSISVDSGSIRFSAVVSPTDYGGVNGSVPVIAKNRTATHLVGPAYQSKAVISSGGSISGGSVMEVIRVSATGASGHAQTVSGEQDNVRMLPAGIYYLCLENTGNSSASGVYGIEWEEL